MLNFQNCFQLTGPKPDPSFLKMFKAGYGIQSFGIVMDI
jgi:hypothetical protein